MDVLMKRILALLLTIVMLLAAAAFAETEFSWEGAGSVSLYSGNPADFTEDIITAFTELTGVKVDVVYGGGGELVARIAAEAENPMADILIGVSGDVTARQADKFESYKLQSVTPDLFGLDELKEEKFFNGVGKEAMVIMVNTELLAEEDYPTRYADLIDEKYRGKIAFVDPSASSSGYIQLSGLVQLYGWDFVEKFYQNLDGRLQSSSGAVPKLCADGEYAIALTYEAGTKDYVAAGANVKVIYPEDGTMPIVSPPVLVKNGPNPENAKLFYEFMFSKAYNEIQTKYGFTPTRNDAAQPEGVPARDTIKFMDYDYAVSGDSETMLNNWNEIVINN